MLTVQRPDSICPDAEAAAFYQRVMGMLHDAHVPFLVGGAFALPRYAGIVRDTKDFDIFLARADVENALELLGGTFDRAELTYPHWLAKVHHGEFVVDLIFNSGNGLCPVDDEWFAHGVPHTVLDTPVRLVPAEEMIWQKAFIMERHRFDGGDVIHLLHACGERLDWQRLERRFQKHPLVLLGHLMFLKFAFAANQPQGMRLLLQRLLEQVHSDVDHDAPLSYEHGPICRGTFLSMLDYLPAVQHGGYRDARLPPTGAMTAEDIEYWTNNFEK